MITIKRPAEIARMRQAGAILVEVLAAMAAELRPGISTAELNELAEGMIRSAGALPSFLGYPGATPFPASICASINDEVVHGIPSPRRRLQAGDAVSLDVGCIWEGWHADTARTWVLPPAPREVQALIDATRRAGDFRTI